MLWYAVICRIDELEVNVISLSRVDTVCLERLDQTFIVVEPFFTFDPPLEWRGKLAQYVVVVRPK
ncbi:hypothetical protein A9X00_28085 [Mycobacterium sp. 1245805.9]|nr:hypothetical protein A9X00_28085 [Mycobacterium sp. 1245805.9]